MTVVSSAPIIFFVSTVYDTKFIGAPIGLTENYYRPQRSWAKVMFLQASVILLTGGVSASVHAGIHPPRADTPRADTPQEQTPPKEQTPPPEQTPAYAQRTAGTHPTGMHSCFRNVYDFYQVPFHLTKYVRKSLILVWAVE